MSDSEFPRFADLRQLTEAPVHLVADEAECAALAERFGIVAVKRLEASLSLVRDGGSVDAKGSFVADIVQPCAVSGEDIPVHLAEAISLRFVPESEAYREGEEIELEESELDEIPFAGTQIDIGEAIAQSLALAIDPYLTGPQAEEARRKAGLLDQTASGPFAALAALKKKD